MSAFPDEADGGPENLNEEIADGIVSDFSQPNGGLRTNLSQIHTAEDVPILEDVKSNGKRSPIAEQIDHELGQGQNTLNPEKHAGPGRPSSADGSLSIPDDTPSIPGSFASSPGRGGRLPSYSRSPTPSLRAFDRRFQSRNATPPASTLRPSSPAFLNIHSRQSSTASYAITDIAETKSEAPWEVVRWTTLRKISDKAFSEIGKRQFGRPTCIAVSASIALGTSKGLILVFDYSQTLRNIIGQGTEATESGSITSLSISADHSTIAGGHASGHIFTWELNKPAKPFLHISPIDRSRVSGTDGHIKGVAVVHIGFLGIRHTALASADDKGMAFSHLATRGMGAVARSVKTTRILGRYPETHSLETRSKKPSSVLAFSPLPLGNAEHVADSMGLVAMLTPYLLVIVSTMPLAQTQFKAPRPKAVAPHGMMTAALAWFPSVKLKAANSLSSEPISRAKLVYCWSNVLSVLDVIEVEPSNPNGQEPLSLQFKPRSQWNAPEAIVAVQWLSRSVLAILTITQRLIILEDVSMIVTDFSDLIQKHVYHRDLFSQQLDHLVGQLDDEEVAAMHGVVADAFHMSFRAYKGRLFLLGHNDVSFGTLSNWADRLLALMDQGQHIDAIRLATAYYTGETDKVTVGLPEDNIARHQVVHEKVLEMMLASLRYSFRGDQRTLNGSESRQELQQLASACITASVCVDEMDFLFEDVFTFYQDGGQDSIFLECLEPFINQDDIVTMPPTVIKRLVEHYTNADLHSRLEEMLCHLDPRTMDIDQITTLCRASRLYDALLYVWSQGIGDYTTILDELLTISNRKPINGDTDANASLGAQIFPYLSYTLTGRIYPTGKEIVDDDSKIAKAEIYSFFFSGSDEERALALPLPTANLPRASFPNLRRILDFDAPGFLSMLNEAFEDSFLNAPEERTAIEISGKLTKGQRFSLSINRQWIINILLKVITPAEFKPHDVVYLDMFVARNLPKFPQHILLPDHTLHRVLIGLCENSDDSIANDCELSVEYLMSRYQPPDLEALIPLIYSARFYRVLKGIYKSEGQYANLLRTCFEDQGNPDAVFECISDCLKPSAKLSQSQRQDVCNVLVDNAHDLVAISVTRAASTIARYAPDLHGTLLMVLSNDKYAQYQYLRIVLEPEEPWGGGMSPSSPTRESVEQYVRLLCEYDSSHVSQYVERVKTGDIRLDEVLPALEQSGIIDVAVVLMAREGKVRNGMERLIQHLHVLQSALSGLVDGLHENPDIQNAVEASSDMVTSISKYARVGIWICRSQTKSAQQNPDNKAPSTGFEDLSSDEELWLDLIDAIVMVVKNVSQNLESYSCLPDPDTQEPTQRLPLGLDTSQMVADLRSIVQEAFTALLAATIPPRTHASTRADAAFLRILRAFLARASRSSPSLSNLRGVLGAIFSAYSHEESLLTLSNRLLDKDLFVKVNEADRLRRRGWRPLGQVCEGCGRRVWGPGTGGSIWEAWQIQNEQRERRRGSLSRSSSRDSSRNRKGKAVTRDERTTAASDGDLTGVGGDDPATSGVVIFSCRHLFHRSCLDRMRDQAPDESGSRTDSELVCPLET